MCGLKQTKDKLMHTSQGNLFSSFIWTMYCVHGVQWPRNDDGKRWVGILPGTRHNRKKPAPHSMSSKVIEDIQRVVSADSSKKKQKTQDIMKGLGIGYVQQMQTALERRGR